MSATCYKPIIFFFFLYTYVGSFVLCPRICGIRNIIKEVNKRIFMNIFVLKILQILSSLGMDGGHLGDVIQKLVWVKSHVLFR